MVDTSSASRSVPGAAVEKARPLLGVAPESEPRVTVANETRARLIIRNGDDALTLAPLEHRSLPEKSHKRLPLAHLEMLGYITSERDVQAGRRTSRAFFLAGSVYGALFFLVWGVFFGTSVEFWTAFGLLLAVAAVVGLTGEHLGVRAVQAIYLAVILVVGVGMPMAAIWAGGNIDHVWHTALHGQGADQDRATLTLLGRGIQTVFIVVVTLLPGLLYFLFDRYRLSTLEEEFTRQIFRLDQTVRTRADLDAKYGHLLGEAYGHQQRGAKSARIQPGTRLPIVIATVIFALGWIVVLLNAEVDEVVIAQGDGLRTLITPWQSATAFAFLGAYVFLLQAALRAYLRGDLRPKFYGYAAMRVVVAVVFAWVLDLMIPTDGAVLLATAFVVGLVPDTFLQRVREFVRTNTVDELIEPHPLTELEGLDVYDRTRLEQEGVTNVEGLAHSNLVELLLQTRIPAGRLVDWADQAQLQLHLDTDKKRTEYLKKLRRRGIRTASDLLVVHRAAQKRSKEDVNALFATLGSEDNLPFVETIIDAVRDDEWMPQILAWHSVKNRAEHVLRYPEDFEDDIPLP